MFFPDFSGAVSQTHVFRHFLGIISTISLLELLCALQRCIYQFGQSFGPAGMLILGPGGMRGTERSLPGREESKAASSQDGKVDDPWAGSSPLSMAGLCRGVFFVNFLALLQANVSNPWFSLRRGDG